MRLGIESKTSPPLWQDRAVDSVRPRSLFGAVAGVVFSMALGAMAGAVVAAQPDHQLTESESKEIFCPGATVITTGNATVVRDFALANGALKTYLRRPNFATKPYFSLWWKDEARDSAEHLSKQNGDLNSVDTGSRLYDWQNSYQNKLLRCANITVKETRTWQFDNGTLNDQNTVYHVGLRKKVTGWKVVSWQRDSN